MKIALDYDGTFTADPEFWLKFIALAHEHNHEVLVATMRTPEEKDTLDDRLVALVPQIVPTSRRAKLPYLAAFGIKPDVWIEDQPQFLFTNGAAPDAMPPDPVIDQLLSFINLEKS